GLKPDAAQGSPHAGAEDPVDRRPPLEPEGARGAASDAREVVGNLEPLKGSELEDLHVESLLDVRHLVRDREERRAGKEEPDRLSIVSDDCAPGVPARAEGAAFALNDHLVRE